MKGKEFLGGILIGAIVGAAVGLLLAPQSGEETREVIKERARDISGKVKDGSQQLLDSSRDLLEQGKSQFSEVLKRGPMKPTGEGSSEA